MDQNKIRVVLTDDHQMVRETWKLLLESDARLSVIAQCSSGAEAIEAAISLNPDIMLMDINMQPLNGFETTIEIVKRMPSMKIIGVSVNNEPSYARTMLESGAKGYVTKNSSRDEMVNAILEVYQGNTYTCKEVRRKMGNHFSN
jgi:two-component system, NarL family, invasion response regulator UvrY